MTYLRSLFLNFLIVFFVDRVVPGVVINSFEQVPNIGADILFSVILGFLNASVYPFLFVLELSATPIKMAVMTFVITFVGFTVISVIPFGVQVISPAGFIVGGLIVWVIAFFSNYLEWKHANPTT
jgi:uncharacterized membrane protein YvlD (DUF360 family)